jgi:hypothetical protein
MIFVWEPLSYLRHCAFNTVCMAAKVSELLKSLRIITEIAFWVGEVLLSCLQQLFLWLQILIRSRPPKSIPVSLFPFYSQIIWDFLEPFLK